MADSLLRERIPRTPVKQILCIAAVVFSLFAESLFAFADTSGELPSLHLTDGSFLPGRVLDSRTPDAITWQSPLFTKPFNFPLGGISAAQYPVATPAPRPTGEYCIELASGDVLYGNLLNLTDTQLGIETKRTGPIHVRRSDVQRIYRWQETALVYLGPSGLEGWSDDAVEAKFSRRWSDEGGWPTTETENATLFQDFNLPPRASIEFELSWKERPDFQLMFGVNKLQSGDLHVFRLEVWEDDVVLIAETERDADVAIVTPIVSGPGAVRGLIYLDQERQRLSLYSRTGRHKASVKIHSKTPATRQGIRLINRKGHLRLNHLRIAHWDGILPRDVQTEKSRIHRTDGTIVYGQVTRFDRNARTFTMRQGDRTTELDAASISDIYLSPANAVEHSSASQPDPKQGSPDDSESAATQLRVVYQDGSRISGRLDSIQHRTIRLVNDSIQEPLSLGMNGLRSLGTVVSSDSLPVKPSKPAGRSGRLELDGVRLQGRLVDGVESETESCLVWHPDFSRNASPLVKTIAGRVVYREVLKKEDRVLPTGQVAQPVRAQAQPPVRNFGDLFQLMIQGKAPIAKGQPKKDTALRTLHLRSGDTIPCRVNSIDEEGVHLTTPLSATTLIAHDRIKGIELSGKKGSPALDETKRDRLLTLPRLQKGSPPTHLIYSTSGDFLRGRLLSMDNENLNVEVRLASRSIPRSRVSQIIWLHEDELKTDDDAPDGSRAEPARSATPGDVTPEKSIAESSEEDAKSTRVQTLRRNDNRLTFRANKLEGSTLSGSSDILGVCQSDLATADQLLFGRYIEQAAARLAYHRWRLHHATEPKFVTASADSGGSPLSGTQSPLVGQLAPDFKLAFLNGDTFRLSEHRGEIVILDFWATWCGPCLQTMPLVEEIVGGFKDHKVALLTVNMEEQATQVEEMLERHQFTMPVLLDRDGVVSLKYEVTSVPQTVVIDRQGIVTRLFVGGGPKLAEPLRNAIQELVDKSNDDSPSAGSTDESDTSN